MYENGMYNESIALIFYDYLSFILFSSSFRKHHVIVLSDEIYARLHYTQSHDTIARVRQIK